MGDSKDTTQNDTASSVAETALDLSETMMSDTNGLIMQNAATAQQSMQTIGNTTVSSGCALIISLGAGGG